jgi:hypothetical protein
MRVSACGDDHRDFDRRFEHHDFDDRFFFRDGHYRRW